MKFKSFVLTVLFIALFVQAKGQLYYLKDFYDQNYNYPGISMLQLEDKSLVICSRYAIVKTDSSGNFIWAKTYNYFHEKLVRGKDGYIYIGGNYNYKEYLTKIDTAGALIWTKIFTIGDTDDWVWLHDLIANEDSSIVLVGEYRFISNLTIDSAKTFFLVTDTTGQIIMSKTYSLLGDFFNGTFSITRRSNGNYLLAGYKGNEDLEESDGFLLEVDNSGNPVQGHSVGTNTNEFIKSVYKDGENFVLNLSNINGVVPSASLIPILVGIDSSFNKSWSKIYNYTCNGPLFEPLIVNKINNNYISNSCYEIVEIDSTGLIISRKPVVIGGLPYTFFSSFINDGKDIYYSGGDWNNTFMVVAKSDSTGYMGCTQINNPVFPCYLSDTISIQSHIIYADSFSVPDSASNVNIAWPSSTTHIDCMTTGIDDTSNGNSIPIKIFPNPAHSSINIELADFHYNSLSLRINDMFGRTILIRQVDKSMILELNNMFTAGIYLLTFYNSVENYNIKLVIN